MDIEPDIPCERVAAFVEQHTHDMRNGLNSLDLEAALLQELVPEGAAQASLVRMRAQLRAVAERLRVISAAFHEPLPIATPIAARALLLIWCEKHSAMEPAPAVAWVDELGEERVSVDVEMMSAVFRELLANAHAFSPGERLTITAGAKGGWVRLALVEPKKEAVEPSAWGQALRTTRRGGYGLGLWAARRRLAANGAVFAQSYESGALTTQIELPIV